MAAQLTVVPFGARRNLAGGLDQAAGSTTESTSSSGLRTERGLELSARHTLVLSGELTHDSASALEMALEQLCEHAGGRITLDMRKLTAIDWAGVMVVAFRCRLCLQRGHEVALIAGPPTVQRVFAQAGQLEELPFMRLISKC